MIALLNRFNRYASWGLAKKKPSLEQVLEMTPASENDIEKAGTFLRKHFDLNHYTVSQTKKVNYYQGDLLENLKVIYLRFEKNNDLNVDLNEHRSFLIDLESLKIMGLIYMEICANSKEYVTHQTALNSALLFLKKHAPDLIPQSVESIKISDKKPGSKITFDAPLKVGNVEIHWIGPHEEKMLKNRKKISGMKVKMYIPSNQLWAWVIVDANNHIQTFERNIFWNFKAFQRETQMWLHDPWLAQHKLFAENKK